MRTIFFAFTALVVGCDFIAEPDPPPELTANAWALVATTGAEFPEASSVLLWFGQEGSLSGSAYCNAASGSYSLGRGHRLTIHRFTPMTRAWCDGKDLEVERILKTVRQYAVRDGRLHLSGRGPAMEFEARVLH